MAATADEIGGVDGPLERDEYVGKGEDEGEGEPSLLDTSEDSSDDWLGFAAPSPGICV